MTTIDELRSRFGSPLYVYRLEQVDAALNDLTEALAKPSALYYSAKANPHPEIIGRLHRAGCRIEISSSGELAAVRASGAAPADCLYTGPGKTPAELALALDAGVRHFSCESLTDLRRVGAAASAVRVRAECLLRVNNTTGVLGGAGMRMAGRPSQFGIGVLDLPGLRSELMSVPGTVISGLHMFTMTNARDEDSLLAEFEASIEIASAAEVPLARLDLGGGFPAPFAAAGSRQRFPNLRPRLEKLLDLRLPGWREQRPHIMFESGRYLAGACGTLVGTTMDLKPSGAGAFVVLDCGINHLGGMAGLGRLARPAVNPCNADDSETGTITGPLCTPADVLGLNVPIGGLSVDGPVIIPNVGAYGLTASLVGFLGRPNPVEVVCDGDRVVSASRLDLVRTPVAGAWR